jgi:hypothetical protein
MINHNGHLDFGFCKIGFCSNGSWHLSMLGLVDPNVDPPLTSELPQFYQTF